MDQRKYEVFLRAIECGSLTRTAAELGYTQAGVSHIVKVLEQEFGFPLFSRSRAGVALTKEGRLLLPVVSELEKWNEQLRQLTAQIKGLEVGSITVGVFESISFSWLPRILAKFHRDYPNIEVGVKVGGTEEIEGWLSENRADIALYSLHPHSGFCTTPLRRDRMMAVLPPDFPVGGRKTFKVEELKGQFFISAPRGNDSDIDAIISRYKIVPSIKFTSTGGQTIISMVENGLGVTILAELMLTGHVSCVQALPLRPAISRTLGMAVPSLKEVSPAVRRFMDCVTSVMKEAPGKAQPQQAAAVR